VVDLLFAASVYHVPIDFDPKRSEVMINRLFAEAFAEIVE
jgi:hypothetical protein